MLTLRRANFAVYREEFIREVTICGGFAVWTCDIDGLTYFNLYPYRLWCLDLHVIMLWLISNLDLDVIMLWLIYTLMTCTTFAI